MLPVAEEAVVSKAHTHMGILASVVEGPRTDRAWKVGHCHIPVTPATQEVQVQPEQHGKETSHHSFLLIREKVFNVTAHHKHELWRTWKGTLWLELGSTI